MTQALSHRVNDKIKKHYYSSRFENTDYPDHSIHIAGVSSVNIEWLLKSLHNFPASCCWLLTKGLYIAENEILTFPQYLSRRLPKWEFAMIAGPALARDVSDINVAIELVLASNVQHEDFISCFNTQSLRFVCTTDTNPVCYLAALKNIYAIILGYAYHKSLSSFAMYYTEAVYELSLWLEYLGYDSKSLYLSAGIGDLLVTSLGGRNARFGQNLSLNLKPSLTLSNMQNVTVEGYALLKNILDIYPNFLYKWFDICPNSILQGLAYAVKYDIPMHDLRM